MSAPLVFSVLLPWRSCVTRDIQLASFLFFSIPSFFSFWDGERETRWQNEHFRICYPSTSQRQPFSLVFVFFYSVVTKKMRTVTRAALVVLSTLSRSLTHPVLGPPDLMRLSPPPAAFVYSVYIAGQCKRAQPVLIHRTCKLWSVDSSRTCRLIPPR